VHWVIEPGFFSSQPVQVALVVGGVTAVVSAIVGVFTVMRGQSFAGHALTDIATTGGSAAFLLGVSPLLGFVTGGVVGSGAMDLIGVQRVRGRDLATGIVLGAAIGLSALLLYLDTTTTATTGATQTILFGSIFTIATSTIPVIALLGAAAVAILAALYRPLLLSAINPDMAAARGVRVRLVGVGFLVSLAVAVALSSIAIGAILSTALLIGPPATAIRLTRRIASSIVVACALGVGSTWVGVLLAYDSYYWGSSHNAYPVSFFIVAVTFVLYLASGLVGRHGRKGAVVPANGIAAAGLTRLALRTDEGPAR
jgi:zinc/manganese transport system permease protein